MKIPLIFTALATLTSFVRADPVPAGPAPSAKKVLIIGTDGTRIDVLEKANTPNIHALMAGGAYSTTAQTRMPTVSGPGWSSMLTGVWSDKHLVKDNKFTVNNYAKYPDLLTRLEQINRGFNTFAAADWPPLLTTDTNGPIISDLIDVKFSFKAVHESGYLDMDRRIADAASAYLARADVDAAFVYFGDVDEVGHADGALSARYKTSVETLDRYVGQVVAAVRSRPSFAREDWLILMSTDHGQTDNGSHGGPSALETGIFFIANGPSVAPGKLAGPVEIVDVAVTAMAHLGVPATGLGLDGKVVGMRGM